MNKLLIIFTLATLITGCGTTYHKLGTGIYGGYSETRLDENIFKVAFLGNVETDAEKISDYAFLRSAEITLESGYSYFKVIGEKIYSEHRSTYTIACFHEKPSGLSYNAKFTKKSISDKYGIK